MWVLCVCVCAGVVGGSSFHLCEAIGWAGKKRGLCLLAPDSSRIVLALSRLTRWWLLVGKRAITQVLSTHVPFRPTPVIHHLGTPW